MGFGDFIRDVQSKLAVKASDAPQTSADPAADLSFLSNASSLYRSTVGNGSKPESYSTTFVTPKGNYTFISEDVVNKGLNVGDNNYWFPYFQNQDNLTNFVNSAQKVDLSNVKASGITSSDTWGNWVSDGLKQSAKGYLVPEGAIPFDSDVKTAPESQMGEIKGLGKTSSGELVYTTSGGHGNMYIAPDGMTHDPYTTYSSILGDVFGDLGESIASPIRDVSDFVHDLGPIGTIGLNVVSPGLGTAITTGNEAGRGNLKGAAINAALGEITGNGLSGEIGVQGTPIWASNPSGADAMAADNIDAGGGWSPATGAAAAVPELSGYDAAMADLAASTPAFTGAETAAAAAAGSSMLDKLPAALGIAAGTTALGSMLIPEIPGMGPAYEAKKTEPDYSIKFDDPVKQLALPDDFNFQLDSTPSPYLTMSQTGPIVGDMLFDPTQAYNSNLVKGLRANSNAPSSVNPGFTLFQSAKP